MKRILLTGGTGVIGRRVLPALVEAGHQVDALARSPEKASAITRAGAEPVTVDLFNADAVADAVTDRDTVIHLATNIPLGAGALRKSAWKTNDRLRTEAADNLASAVIGTGAATYIGESITFPYLDAGPDWIDESQPRDHHAGTKTVIDAEAAARRVTESGGTGVVLRFAMFHAVDSGHIGTFLAMAKRGLAPFFGRPDGFQSFIDADDAARAVVAALDAPPGVYNVAEPDPKTRAEHSAELAAVVGRKKLRPVPNVLQRLGGDEVEGLGRSQRISSRTLEQAGAWEPRVDVITRWKELI